MQFRVLSVRFAEVPCTTRMPFRFGAVTLHQAPLFHARVELESVDGRTAVGLASDLLVPKWFRKDPARSVEQDQSDLRHAAAEAGKALLAHHRHATAFDLCFEAWRSTAGAVEHGAPDRLVRGFGAALVERAVLDAACRIANRNLWSALQQDLFRFEPERFHPELRGWRLPALLPTTLPTAVAVRHTVGMLDPLSRAEAGTGPGDGEPNCLVDELDQRGIRWLKVKVGAGPDADHARLLSIATALGDRIGTVRITLDGNEQYAELAALAEVLDRTAAAPMGRALVSRIVAVEQPLPRQLSFSADAQRDLPLVSRHAPLLVDEADDGPEAFRNALDTGYRGISVKNCKGFFRALANHGLCAARGNGAFLSAEDLTNLPVVALQQDLLTVCCLGLAHVERNGHHYFRGLDHLPDHVASAALAAHPDLYEARADGSVRLRIGAGRVECASLLGRGYAVDHEVAAALDQALPWVLED
ncbi:MAG: hypothetical protein RL148_188 [Planctomycetota bacterium]|jgi:hypothetical protein